MELTIRHTTPDIRCTQLYSLTMTTKATFCQLPTPYCFTASLAVATRYAYISLLSSLKLRQTKRTTGDSCDSGISMLNHCLSWSKFVNTHLYHFRQWFNIHISSLMEVITVKLICDLQTFISILLY